jgi:archaellum component FlaC
MGVITKDDLNQLRDDLTAKIESQGETLRKEMKEQGETLRKEMKEQGETLRKEMKEQGETLRQEMKQSNEKLRLEIKESADSVLEVINSMATASSNQFMQIDEKLENIHLDIVMIKRDINRLNTEIDGAYKNKSITEDETIALIAGQRRLERWVEQIASESGIKLASNI